MLARKVWKFAEFAAAAVAAAGGGKVIASDDMAVAVGLMTGDETLELQGVGANGGVDMFLAPGEAPGPALDFAGA